MKKTGYFFLALTPFLLATAIQFFAMFFVYGVSFATDLIYNINNLKINHVMYEVYSMLSDYNFSNFIMIIYSIIVICVFSIWYYTRLGGEFKFEFESNFNLMKILGIIIIIPGAQFLSGYITSITAFLVPKWMDEYTEIMDMAGFDDELTVVIFLYAVVFAPLCEELIFRGVTMNLFKLALPFWAANLFQAIMFGIYHMNWIQGIYAFVLGLILGYVCEKCGKIYYSILLHALFNFWGTVISGFLPDEIPDIFAIFMFLIMLLSLICGFLLIYFGNKKTNAVPN